MVKIVGRLMMPRMIFENLRGARAMIDIALEAAVREPRRDFSDVTLLDRLAAERAKGLRAGGPAIHQDELHVASLCDANGAGWLSPLGRGLEVARRSIP